MVVPSFRVTNDAYCHGQGNTDVLAAQSPVATTKSWAVFRLAPQDHGVLHGVRVVLLADGRGLEPQPFVEPDRKSTRLNSSHSQISYAVFCLKKKKTNK